jgi:hypothetical protein
MLCKSESQGCLVILNQQAITSDQACCEVARKQIMAKLVVNQKQMLKEVVKHHMVQGVADETGNIT